MGLDYDLLLLNNVQINYSSSALSSKYIYKKDGQFGVYNGKTHICIGSANTYIWFEQTLGRSIKVNVHVH